MTQPHLPVYVGPDALAELVRFCGEHQLTHFVLIADDNTYAALGARAESALRAQGCDVLTVVLQGDEIGADARSAFQVLLALDRVPRIFIGVGSGTITDVARSSATASARSSSRCRRPPRWTASPRSARRRSSTGPRSR